MERLNFIMRTQGLGREERRDKYFDDVQKIGPFFGCRTLDRMASFAGNQCSGFWCDAGQRKHDKTEFERLHEMSVCYWP